MKRNRKIQRGERAPGIMLLCLCFAMLTSSGCGQTAKSITPSSADLVYSYFGGPFSGSGGSLGKSSSTFDHAANQIGVSAFITNQTASVPTGIMNGTFVTASTGFLSITENFVTTSAGVLAAQNPPLTGAWAVEIPGAGALANLLSLGGAGSSLAVAAAPTVMVDNTTCPNFTANTTNAPSKVPFLYVTVPSPKLTNDTSDYGLTNISTQGSAVTFETTPYLVGLIQQPASTVTGGCSLTNLGALTAYPLNFFGSTSNFDLVSIGTSGLLISSFSTGSFSSGNSGSLSAFGVDAGVIGVVESSVPVDVNAVNTAKYNGFIYAPLNGAHQTYDITVLASAFGDHAATSSACSALQSSLAANNGQGAKTVPVLPSANSLYGGEFLTTTSSGAVNDPSGAIGSEDCDVVIDLGTQDPANNGLFPNATVFIGSNYPPYSGANPWNCSDTGSACAVSFPAAAIVGQVQGQYVIFVGASAASSPAARLPDAFGNRQPQPVGIYLFQKQ